MRPRSFWNYLRRPSRDTLMILERINKMDANLLALKTTLDNYVAKVDAYVVAAEQYKADTATAVAAAVAADDADEAVDVAALKDAIEAAGAKVPAPPVAPPFDPSANG